MSAAKKHKRSKKAMRFEMSRLALLGWCFGLVLALLWMFLLGLFVGKGITPANINFAAIKKRMIAEGVWPGSGKTHRREEVSPSEKAKKQIPLNDLEFYEKLAKKKKAQLREQSKAEPSPQKGTTPTVSPPPATSAEQDIASKKQPRPATGKFTVQLASFKDLASARKFAARFNDLKPQATIRQVDLTGKGRWYRVHIGELSSRDEASAFAKRFNKKYRLQALVVALEE
jgi:cell division septation protein DedD